MEVKHTQTIPSVSQVNIYSENKPCKNQICGRPPQSGSKVGPGSFSVFDKS